MVFFRLHELDFQTLLVGACVVEGEATNESLQLTGASYGLHGWGRVVEGGTRSM